MPGSWSRSTTGWSYRLQSPDFTGTIKVGSNEEVGCRPHGRHPRSLQAPVPRGDHRVRDRPEPRAHAAAERRQDRRRRHPGDRGRGARRRHRAVVGRVAGGPPTATCPTDEGVVPLITYGTHGFYRPVSEPILERHGVDYEYTVNAPTSANVRAAVEAGLGVAVLRERFLTGDVVEWARAADFDPLPTDAAGGAHRTGRAVELWRRPSSTRSPRSSSSCPSVWPPRASWDARRRARRLPDGGAGVARRPTVPA